MDENGQDRGYVMRMLMYTAASVRKREEGLPQKKKRHEELRSDVSSERGEETVLEERGPPERIRESENEDQG